MILNAFFLNRNNQVIGPGTALGIRNCAALLDVLLVQFVSWRILLPSCDDCILLISLLHLLHTVLTNIYALPQTLVRHTYFFRERKQLDIEEKWKWSFRNIDLNKNNFHSMHLFKELTCSWKNKRNIICLISSLSLSSLTFAEQSK